MKRLFVCLNVFLVLRTPIDYPDFDRFRYKITYRYKINLLQFFLRKLKVLL